MPSYATFTLRSDNISHKAPTYFVAVDGRLQAAIVALVLGT